MTVVNKNSGTKIEYEVNETVILFDESLEISLTEREKDYPVHIDVSKDNVGNLVLGVSRKYVAQIDIPARQYQEVETGDEENPISYEALPLNIDNVVLTLWEV